jgi:hypothetical protein
MGAAALPFWAGQSLLLANENLLRGDIDLNQSKRALTKSLGGGFFFHPTDEDLSVGTPLRKNPLGGLASGVQLFWFRDKPDIPLFAKISI